MTNQILIVHHQNIYQKSILSHTNTFWVFFIWKKIQFLYTTFYKIFKYNIHIIHRDSKVFSSKIYHCCALESVQEAFCWRVFLKCNIFDLWFCFLNITWDKLFKVILKGKECYCNVYNNNFFFCFKKFEILIINQGGISLIKLSSFNNYSGWVSKIISDNQYWTGKFIQRLIKL